MVRFALLGCGRIGRVHAANIAAGKRSTLAVVYDVRPDEAREVAMQYGARVATDAGEVFSASDVDAVLVATSTQTHADFIEAAVAARRPVFCEKPIALDLDRVKQCAARIHGAQSTVQIGFNRRFDAGIAAMSAAVSAGEIGRVRQVVITSRDPGMPPSAYCKVSGGIFRDMTIHDFDMARFLLGEDPTYVFATGSRLVAPGLMAETGDFDTAMIVMRAASGAQCHINNCRSSVYGYDQRVEVFGDEGMLATGNHRPHELRKFSSQATEAAAPYLHFFIERYRQAFAAELDAFVTAVEGDAQPVVGFDDGLKALLLAEAAKRSAESGRVVRLDEVS